MQAVSTFACLCVDRNRAELSEQNKLSAVEVNKSMESFRAETICVSLWIETGHFKVAVAEVDCMCVSVRETERERQRCQCHSVPCS